MQALAGLAVSLPMPVVREHIQGPLLLSLYRRPDVALALISVAGALGSTYTATQIIPPLLAILTSSVSGPAGMLTLIERHVAPYDSQGRCRAAVSALLFITSLSCMNAHSPATCPHMAL